MCMPVIRVEMLRGRTVEQKRKLAAAITDAMVEIAGARPEATTIFFYEVERENLARNGELYVETDDSRTGQQP